MTHSTALTPLSGEQVRAVIEKHAQVLGVGFTEALVRLARDGGMGRSTVFLWVNTGLPNRQNSSVRSTLIRLAREYGIIEQSGEN